MPKVTSLEACHGNAGVCLLCALIADGSVWLVHDVQLFLQALNYSSPFYLVMKGKHKKRFVWLLLFHDYYQGTTFEVISPISEFKCCQIRPCPDFWSPLSCRVEQEFPKP